MDVVEITRELDLVWTETRGTGTRREKTRPSRTETRGTGLKRGLKKEDYEEEED